MHNLREIPNLTLFFLLTPRKLNSINYYSQKDYTKTNDFKLHVIQLYYATNRPR